MNKFKRNPPILGQWILKRLLPEEERPFFIGDMEETYAEKRNEKGLTAAFVWYWFQFFIAVPPIIIDHIKWSITMFKNYMKTSLRNILKYKGISLINISGLALGMTAFILISVWVMYEFSYDRFHENKENIYRVNEKRHFQGNVEYSQRTPGLLSSELKSAFPEIKSSARHAWTGTRVMKYEDKMYNENWIVCVDREFLDIFSFPLVKGDKNSVLNDPYAIVISEEISKKYFGDEDPVGKVLTMDDRYNFTVTGVLKDVPSNSHLQFNMLVPFKVVETLGWMVDSWTFSLASTYLQLEKGADADQFERKIAGFIKNFDENTNRELFLQPVTRIALYSNFRNPESGRIQYVYIFSIIGILILIMACINFMNLTTARSENRSKEICIRKIAGAHKGNLRRQFLSESVLIAFLGLILTPLLIFLALPEFNEITEESFSIADFGKLKVVLFVLGITVLTGIISGSYPALFLSALQPVKALKGKLVSGFRSAFLRKTFVILQISISIAMIIVSGIIFHQIDFLKNKDLGFDKEHVISIPLGMNNPENGRIYHELKDRFRQDPGIKNVSGAWTHPLYFASPTDNVVYNGKKLDEETPISITSVGFDFIETFRIKILSGRSFSKVFGAERRNMIVNESFAKLMGERDPMNKTFFIGETECKIVGIMKDFHIESVVNAPIGPFVVFLHDTGINYVFVRVRPENISSTVAFIEKTWKEINPDTPLNYTFIDREFNRQFRSLDILNKILRYFTLIAVFIAGLGLFGLASFAAEKRAKEIGIRKVLGSSVAAVIYLLCKDFIKLVVLANLFAWPVSLLVMNNWLQNFPYHTGINWLIFILAGTAALVITLLTVSIRTVKAALINPVDSLRNE
jgi:ABC-type antimicrobial peptide transport system permease subunit